MGKMYGHVYSQTTISRFEALAFSFKGMLKLKELLAKWLEDADSNGGMYCNSLSSADRMGRGRKKRTTFETTKQKFLEKAFAKNPKPTSEEMDDVADTLNVDYQVVRVWFSNRSGLLYYPSIK